MRIVLVITFILMSASTVHAATIAVLRPGKGSPELTEALFRLQGELLAVGLEVVVDDRPPGFGSDTSARNTWFQQMASERGIDAIIDVVGYPGPVGADVWIFQTSSRRFSASRVVVEPHTLNAPETLAIRAIEVLRANFLVFDSADKQQRDERVREPIQEAPQPVDEAPRAEPEAVPRFGAAAGATLLTSFDGVGAAVLPLVRFDWTLYRGFALAATLSGFGTRPTVETEAGSVRVRQSYGVMGVGYSIPSESFVAAFLALSAGAMRTTLDGSADSPNRGHHVQQWAFLAEGSLGARFELSRRFYLCLAGHAQLTAPYAAIHFVDAQVATTGRPNLLASLTLGVWL